MKKILIVTGSDYSDLVYKGFEDVKKLGHELYLLSDGSFEPKEGIFEKHFSYDLRKTKEVLDYMDKQNMHFDAVTIKTSEWLTPLVALLAKKYGCIGNDPIVAFYCRSKYHMRKIFEENNIPSPKFKLCKNFNDILEALKEIQPPCVAKPVGANASYGTFMIQDMKDIEKYRKQYEDSIEFLKKKAIKDDVFTFNEEELDLMGVKDKVDMTTDYLIEEYMEGHEISIDALVQEGKVTITGIEDQIRMKPPYFMQIAAKLPYTCSEEEKKTIYDLVEKTIHALGIKNSATHTEIIFSPEGPKIVEIACRIGGDDLHDTIYEVTGYNLMYESIMIALGVKRDYDVKTKCHVAMKYLIPDKKGIIKKIEIPEEVIEDPNLVGMPFGFNVGDYIAPPPEMFEFMGYISVKGETPSGAWENLEEMEHKIKIVIE